MNAGLPLAFLSGSLGSGELLLVFVVTLALFGPRRLPEIARKLGQAMHALRRASQDVQDQIMRMDQEPASADDEPVKAALPSVVSGNESGAGAGTAAAAPAAPPAAPDTAPHHDERPTHGFAG